MGQWWGKAQAVGIPVEAIRDKIRKIADEAIPAKDGDALPKHGSPELMRFAAAILGALILAGCQDRGKCLRTHSEVYYPNMGLIALGTAYLPLAMMRKIRAVCDQWERPRQ